MMTLVMGVMTNNMPKRQNDNDDDDSVKKMKLTRSYKMQPFVILTAEYMSMMKHMGDLEEKVVVLESQPHEIPAEKEEILNKALARVKALEIELAATDKIAHAEKVWIMVLKTVRTIWARTLKLETTVHRQRAPLYLNVQAFRVWFLTQ